MCLTCGCGEPYDDMGDAKNVTYGDIKKAVETPDGKGLSTDQAVKNLNDTWAKVKDEDKDYKAKSESEQG